MERTRQKNRSAAALAAPNLDCLEGILVELHEAIEEFEALRARLHRHKRGGETYMGVVADLCVSAAVLEAKARSLADDAQAIIEALPED